MLSDKTIAELKDTNWAELLLVNKILFQEMVPPEFRRDRYNEWSEVMRSVLPAEINEDEELLSITEFVEKTGDPPPMIADGILSANSLIIISAQPKQGKTFFALQIAEDIAKGRPLLGKYAVEKAGPVVYFAMEGAKHLWKDRIVRKGMDRGEPPIYIYTGRKDFSTPAGVEWLIKKVEPIKPTVIIIDTARQALDMEEWNNADKVNARIRPLVDAVQQRGNLILHDGCCIILIHHNNKNAMAEGGNKMSGSNALQSNADGYIIIDHKKRTPDGNMQAKAECEGRVDMPSEFIWEMDTETYQIKVLEDTEAAAAEAAHKKGLLERHFPKVIHAIGLYTGGATVAEIETKAQVNRTTLNKVITEMVLQGLIEQTGTRPSKRGAPSALFNLTSIYIGDKLNQAPEKSTERPDVDHFFDGTAESTKPADSDEEYE